jgi:hypothetical protein
MVRGRGGRWKHAFGRWMKRKRRSPQSRPRQESPTKKLQLGWQDRKAFSFRDLVGVLECLGIFRLGPSSDRSSKDDFWFHNPDFPRPKCHLTMLLFENYVRFSTEIFRQLTDSIRRPLKGPHSQFSAYANASLIPVVFYTDSAAIANSSSSAPFQLSRRAKCHHPSHKSAPCQNRG